MRGISRRAFIGGLGAALAGIRLAWADRFPSDLKITRIVSFDLHTRRKKYIGKNAIREDHGQESLDRMARLYTNVGVEAVGRCWVSNDQLIALLGTNPFKDFDLASRHIASPLGRRTMVLWDLAGKLLKQPVYRLLGGEKPGKVPVYDGSIYFSDLLPDYAQRWQDRFSAEIDIGLREGHRAFKIKIGRGNMWMDRAAGDERDVAVLETIRKHVGKDVILGVDANNGYDLRGIKRFVERTEHLDLAFLEEPFPEQVAPCLELKQFMADKGLKTLLADGEGVNDLAVYRPFVEARALDVLQGSMNGFGIEGILAMAAMAQPHGILVAPHNWSSLPGLYQQVQVGLVIPNFYRAEHDPLESDVLVAEGYKIEDGLCSVPDAPGFGLAIDEKNFAHVRPLLDLKT